MAFLVTRVGKEGFELEDLPDQGPAVRHVGDYHRGTTFATIPVHPLATERLGEAQVLAQDRAYDGEQAKSEGKDQQNLSLSLQTRFHQ